MDDSMRKYIKILVIVVIALFFFPMFTVSCSGMGISEDVSAFRASIGYNWDENTTISNPAPILEILLVIPCLMLTFCLLKEINNKLVYIICSTLSLVEMIGYMIFKGVVKKFSNENGCAFKVLFLYYLNLLLLIAIMVISVAGIVQKNSISGVISNKSIRPKQKIDEGWVCPDCGIHYTMDSVFCGQCGKSYEDAKSESMVVQVEEDSPKQFCQSCGSPIDADTIFCGKCGYKIGG